MSDLDNLKLLKQMLENSGPTQKESENAAVRERKFIADVTKAYLDSVNSGESGIRSYKPEQIIDFIKTSEAKLQNLMGGEWIEMDSMAFDALSYTVLQKMQKSASLIDWNS